MINREENPSYINSFLDYTATILTRRHTCFFKLYGNRIEKQSYY